MEEAEKCDRLAILSHGNLVGLGTPAQLKSEIGGDVILLDAHEPQKLAAAVNERFAAGAAVLDDGRVRIEREAGHRFITDVVEAFPGEIDSVSVSKPTLEDVFIRRTGHRFWNEDAQGLEERAETTKKKH
jgi:ABC-2 type transport system ATP-binding protein